MGKKKKSINVKYGSFIKEPKCEIFDTDLTHEWLGGDYTLLLCESPICLDKLKEKRERDIYIK